MERENFIELLNRSSPNDIREFLISKGKHKSITPFIYDNKKEEVDKNNKKDQK